MSKDIKEKEVEMVEEDSQDPSIEEHHGHGATDECALVSDTRTIFVG